ncbi:MAG: response regulator [bacterium]|nr:response regulator [bacterium]
MAKILVIDDDSKFRKMFRQMLEKAGYEIQEAENGGEGIKIYVEDPADLVITDIFMPEKEGIETIFELKRDYPGIKVIAISGGGKTGDFRFLEYTKEFGVTEIFSKPFEKNVILGKIEEILNG